MRNKKVVKKNSNEVKNPVSDNSEQKDEGSPIVKTNPFPGVNQHKNPSPLLDKITKKQIPEPEEEKKTVGVGYNDPESQILKLKKSSSISSSAFPEVVQIQKIQEEINYITDDIFLMPVSAEKISLDLLQKLLKHKADGAVNLSSEESIGSIYANLEHRIKTEELNSQSVSQILVDLKSKTSISDGIMCLRKLIKEIRPLNIREIVRLVTKAAEGNSLISGQDIVLFIGETGTGKSTTIQFLAGCKMGEKRVEIAKGVFIDHHIEAVSFPDDNPTLKEVKSSCLNQSETRYIKPVKIDLRKLLGVTAKGFMNLCDAPGSGDTAGAEIDIANGVGIINAIKQCTSVKVVALISSRSGNRGEGIRKLARLLVNLIKDIEDRLDSILYLFTKYPRDYNSHGDLISLKESLETTDPEIEKDSGFMMVINDMIEKTENETLIVDPIEGDPKKILKTLIKMKEIKNPDESFQYALTQDSNNTIRSQIYKDLASIACGLKNKNSELALFYLNNIKTLNDLIEKDFLKEAYTVAINLISETLQNCVKETKTKFNKALHSQDGLQQEDIQEYNNAIDYIKSSQIFIDHLDVQLFSPNLFLQNISIELEKMKKINEEKSISDPLIKLFFNNVYSLSFLFPELIDYKKECEKFVVRINKFCENIEKIVVYNKLSEFSDKMVILHDCLTHLKGHQIYIEIRQKYTDNIKLILSHFSQYSKNSIFDKENFEKEDLQTLKQYLKLFREVKETSSLQSHISLYLKLLNPDEIVDFQENFKDFNGILNEFMSQIRKYFNKINTKIQNLSKGKNEAVLT